MPALTVKAVTKALSEYVRPDEDLVAKLNLVMPRLYAMGMWKDLLYDWSIETTNDYFALPEHSESLLGAMLQDSPVEARSQWHDYRIGGYAKAGPSPIFGVVDDGYHPTKEDIIYETLSDGDLVVVNHVQPATNLPSEGSITIVYGRSTDSVFGEDSVATHTFNLNGSQLSTPSSDISSIKSISFEDVPESVKVCYDYQAAGSDSVTITLAVVKGDGVARYRRFRFSNPSAEVKNIKLLLKRAWEPVLVQDDLIYLGNLNAIKHGLLGMLAEDNADLERAQYHWTICQKLLDEELDAARGAAKPRVSLDPSGSRSTIPNII
jgi:hypothetical protein